MSDQDYIIDLCDKVLSRTAHRQYRFDFLRGDTGRTLPVDAFYRDLNLVIEYHERQHFDDVQFWDCKPTASGIPRGQQRALYDQRRRDVLPAHGITLIELRCTEFECKSNKQLVRIPEQDQLVIRARLIEAGCLGANLTSDE